MLIIEWAGVVSLGLIIITGLTMGILKVKHIITIYRQHKHKNEWVKLKDESKVERGNVPPQVGWRSLPLIPNEEEEENHIWLKHESREERQRREPRKRRPESLPPARKRHTKKKVEEVLYEKLSPSAQQSKTNHSLMDIKKEEDRERDGLASEQEMSSRQEEVLMARKTSEEREAEKRRSIKEWTEKLLQIARE